MKIRELMSSPAYSVEPQDSLERAAQLLWEHDVGMVPVVDPDGRVRAAITDRDICMATYLRGSRLADLRVADSMSRGCVTCRPDDDVESAAQRMAQHQLHRLPVVDAAGKAIGVISLNDLALASADSSRCGHDALKALVALSQHRAKVPAVIPAAAPARTDGVARAASLPAGRAAATSLATPL